MQRKRVKLLRLCHSQLEKIVGETTIRYKILLVATMRPLHFIERSNEDFLIDVKRF